MIDIPSIYATENRRLTERLLDAVSAGIASMRHRKLAHLRYWLAISIFSSIGCALVDETPTIPITEIMAPAIEQPIVTSPQPAMPVLIELPLITSFREAVSTAADALFLQASPQFGSHTTPARQAWMIDPLIDGVSGMQSNATRAIEVRAIEVARSKYPQLALRSFSPANLDEAPLLMLGTLTAVNKAGATTGRREAFSICLVLANLKTRTIAAKVTTRTYMDGVDHRPTPYFHDSPAWIKEGSTDGYIATCQKTKVGDPIQTSYLSGMSAAALVTKAITAYDHGRYRDALDLFTESLKNDGGNHLLIYNGLYLTNWRVGRHAAANEVFSKLVDHGLLHNGLAVKFLFKPGTTAYWADRRISGSYSMWLKHIARRAARSNACLEITGHTSATGAETLNERLSQLRAEYIKKQLELQVPQLRARTIASGAGSRENLLGTGKDDTSDTLDRRIVFQVHSCL